MMVGFTTPDKLLNPPNVQKIRQCQNPELRFVLKPNISNEEEFQRALNFTTFPEERTCKDDLFLIMLINSAPENNKRRDAVRETWGSLRTVQGQKMRVIFVLAKAQMPSTNKRVLAESKIYRDLLIFDFFETHINLTLKLVGGLKWVSEHCNNAKYMYKGDDDMFVNIDIIIAHLTLAKGTPGINGSFYSPVYIYDDIPKKRLYIGSLNPGPVMRNKRNKYYVSHDDYFGKYFPLFVSGGGYVISCDNGEVISALYRASFDVFLMNCDDVYQGILAKKIGLRPVDHPGFKNFAVAGRIHTCTLRRRIWTFHGVYGNKLKAFWHRFTMFVETCL